MEEHWRSSPRNRLGIPSSSDSSLKSSFYFLDEVQILVGKIDEFLEYISLLMLDESWVYGSAKKKSKNENDFKLAMCWYTDKGMDQIINKGKGVFSSFEQSV